MDNNGMTGFRWNQFREPNPRFLQEEDIDLNTIRINQNISPDDCLQMLSLLENKTDLPLKTYQINNGKIMDTSRSFFKGYKNNQEHNSWKPRSQSGQNYIKIPKNDLQNIKRSSIIDKEMDNSIKFFHKNSTKMAFQVVYGKYKPYKKNKQWTFDGFLSVKEEKITLYGISGKILAITNRNGEGIPKLLVQGTQLYIGQWECELCDEIVYEVLESGSFFVKDQNELS